MAREAANCQLPLRRVFAFFLVALSCVNELVTISADREPRSHKPRKPNAKSEKFKINFNAYEAERLLLEGGGGSLELEVLW